MINLQGVYKIQAEYNVADGNFRNSEVSFEEYLSQCRVYLSSNLPEGYTKGNLDAKAKQSVLETLASEFVDKHRIKVKGYTSKEGIVNAELLLTDVRDAITGVAVIREALDDPDVEEIQINDLKTVFIVRNGENIPFVDKNGRVMQFESNDDILILINKLIDDGTGNIPQFTDGRPLLNAKTAKHQYRVNAVHPVANTICKSPFNFPVTNITLRKFKEVHLTVNDLIVGRSVNEKMARFLRLLGRAEAKLFCVGPTGSGKTTLLRIIASEIPLNKRILLIQNPTEISFYERDEYGRLIRNVVHHEVFEGTGDSKYAASMSNLISNALRETPSVIIPGEARDPEEFVQILRALKTGHRVLSTFHATDADDALDRFADETGKLPKDIAKHIDIVISQFKFDCGDRRVMEISEIAGIDNSGKPIINTLFEFQYTGEVEIINGKKKMKGEFKQVGRISKRLEKIFYKSEITKSEIEEFINPVGNDG